MSSSSAFDAIIVGSGAGGAAAAFQLVRAGLRVALVEKGGPLPQDASTLDFNRVVHEGIFKSHEQWLDNQGRRFSPEEYFNLGGKTKWYGAALLRYGPDGILQGSGSPVPRVADHLRRITAVLRAGRAIALCPQLR